MAETGGVVVGSGMGGGVCLRLKRLFLFAYFLFDATKRKYAGVSRITNNISYTKLVLLNRAEYNQIQ